MTGLPLAVRALTGVHHNTTKCWRQGCNAQSATGLQLCVPCHRELQRLPGGRP